MSNGQQQQAQRASSSTSNGGAHQVSRASSSSSKVPSSTPISDSMLRRMAGQSVNKAGLNIDQSEINKIIAEASKGSKFYENERVKDELLGRKIQATLQKRDFLLLTADIPRLEAECDKIIDFLESTRDLSRTIVHVDLDAFFASVEELADPSLKGIAFGVGGGVLTTASYEARKFGVRSGMAGFVARKLCPHIKLVKPNFTEYNKWSHKVFSVARRYDPNLAKAGCDEGYLDITEYMDEHERSAEDVVQHFRAACVKETGLTVSAGIAPNKMLAKICSDINKPNGQFSLDFNADAVKEFTRTLKIRKVPGIGKVSERILESLGIITCGDIFTHRGVLHLLDYGVTDLLRSALGCCSNNVEPGKRSDRKSVGVESTFRDMTKREDLVKKLEEIADELTEHLTSLRFVGRTLQFKYKTHEYKPFTRNKTISGEFRGKEEILRVGLALLEKELPLRIRLMGLRVMNLRDLDLEKKGGLDGFVTRSPPKKPKATNTKPRATSEEGSDSQNAIALSDDEGGDSDEDGMKKFGDEALLADELEVNEDGFRLETPDIAEEGGEQVEPQTCPVCSHIFKPTSSNEEVNSHVDFCLSRDTISSLASSSSNNNNSKPSSMAGKKRSSKDSEIIVVDDDVEEDPGPSTKKPKKAEKKVVEPLNAFEKMMNAQKSRS
ncbi:hypothetical protein BDY24DRAFT_396835 [Mrakia frigida]|uniref:Y-family DNA polymerase n=1 Tax=Mrakia frigida TaxID=29902 RepID=UPI003FCC176D